MPPDFPVLPCSLRLRPWNVCGSCLRLCRPPQPLGCALTASTAPSEPPSELPEPLQPLNCTPVAPKCAPPQAPQLSSQAQHFDPTSFPSQTLLPWCPGPQTCCLHLPPRSCQSGAAPSPHVLSWGGPCAQPLLFTSSYSVSPGHKGSVCHGTYQGFHLLLCVHPVPPALQPALCPTGLCDGHPSRDIFAFLGSSPRRSPPEPSSSLSGTSTAVCWRTLELSLSFKTCLRAVSKPSAIFVLLQLIAK